MHVDDVDLMAETAEAGDERVAGRVGSDEAGVGGEGAPRPADEADAAERLGWDAEQDLVEHVRRQLDVVSDDRCCSAGASQR